MCVRGENILIKKLVISFDKKSFFPCNSASTNDDSDGDESLSFQRANLASHLIDKCRVSTLSRNELVKCNLMIFNVFESSEIYFSCAFPISSSSTHVNGVKFSTSMT